MHISDLAGVGRESQGRVGGQSSLGAFSHCCCGKEELAAEGGLALNQPAEVTFVLNRPSISSTQVTMAEIFPRFPDLQASCLSKLLPGTQG